MNMSIRVIAIFDIGKTNKKFFLFSEQYRIVYERSVHVAETTDEEGFACDDIQAITNWVRNTLAEALLLQDFVIRAVNVSAYGASFIHIDDKGKPVGALYNYLNPYPLDLQETFYAKYGGSTDFSLATASPVLGNLNSGLQIYRLLHQRAGWYEQVAYSLHLPQYISYLISGKPAAEITSIGCHTALWDFTRKQYHEWVYDHNIDEKFPPVLRSDATIAIELDGQQRKAGIGMHDSSAALVPYLRSFSEPFILISTGTWCISLNPFNSEPLTKEELEQDCLCYLDYHRRPVKASRVFAGNEHEHQVKRIAAHFAMEEQFYQSLVFNPAIYGKLNIAQAAKDTMTGLQHSAFVARDLAAFHTAEEAYHQLIFDLIQQQQVSVSLVLSNRRPPGYLWMAVLPVTHYICRCWHKHFQE